jgi:ribose-phosphate pyrophosphokinase
MLVFALDASRDIGSAIARALGVTLAAHEERRFEDGEHKVRPLVDPAGADCYVVQSLHGGPTAGGDEKLLRLLMMIAALRDHGARRVTAVVPYLAYARKDRRTQPFDPLSLRVVAQLFEVVGTDALIALEAHSAAAFDNALRLRAVNLDPGDLFAAAAEPLLGGEPVVVASPDIGGVKRVQVWRERLEARWGRALGQAFVDKRRSAGVVSGGTIVAGHVAGCTVLLRDDLISTFGTIARATEALLAAGARRVLAFAAHGLFVGEAAAMLAANRVERVFVTDSVPPFRLAPGPARARVEVLASAALFAAAIRHEAAVRGSP